MHTDPIADMLTRIRNAQRVKKTEVVLPYSNFKFNLAKVLSAHNWVGGVKIIEPDAGIKKNQDIAKFRQIKIELLYENNTPKITTLNRVSKPGQRVYATHKNLPVVRNNFGLAIISTPKGILTNKEAKKAGVGGEIICEIY